MKILVTCRECTLEDVKAHVYRSNGFYVDVRSGHHYTATCPREHKLDFMLSNPDFEILFEHGCMALIEDYPREAVTSFIAALERFYEFYIHVACHKLGIALEDMLTTWKYTPYSENQRGAFFYAYLFAHKRPLDPRFNKGLKKWTELRNNAVHNGIIPSFEDSYSFGKWVSEWIIVLLSEFGVGDINIASEVMWKHIQHERDKLPPSNLASAVGTLTVLSTQHFNVDRSLETFDKKFQQLKDGMMAVHKGQVIL